MDEDEQKGLSALLAYLSVEAAATAILRVTSGECETVHLNAAFEALGNVEQELGDLREALKRTLAREKDVALLHGRNLEGERWRIRVVSSRHCVATALEHRPVLLQQNGHHGEASHDQMDTATDQLDEQSLDWTIGPVKNTSPWIDFLRNYDWKSTVAGPMESWSPLLRQYVLHIMSNPDPRLLVFGEGMAFIYNEACIEFFGTKHPQAMGQSVADAWSEVWDDVKLMIEGAYNGNMTKLADCPMFLKRHGYLEETYWNFAMVPIIDRDTGRGVGLIDEITEVSLHVTDERRRVHISKLSEQTKKAENLPDLWRSVLDSLQAADIDIPYAILYSVVDDIPEGEDGSGSRSSASEATTHHPKKAVLAGVMGIAHDNPNLTEYFALPVLNSDSDIVLHCSQAWESRIAQYISIDDGTLPAWLTVPNPERSFGDEIRNALVSPLRSAGDDVLGILVIGLSPRVPLNSAYKLYLRFTAEMIEKAAALISLPDEQRRAQAITDDITTSLTQQLRLYTLRAEKSEAKFSRMAASSPIGMYMFCAKDGKPLYANDAYLELLGVSREAHAIRCKPIASAWDDLIHDEDIDRFIDAWDQVTKAKLPVSIEYRLKKTWTSVDKSTGQELSGEHWLQSTAFPEIDPDGTVSTVQGWVLDVSHRKFSERIQAQRLEDALENKRQTENFIDMTSHEMRNPLSAILQSADSIVSTLSGDAPIINENVSLSAEVTEDLIDAAQTIILCGQHQKRIVDDILTLSKLDASLLVISPDKVQAPALIKKALKMYEAEIERAGIETTLCIEPTYEELGVDWVILDPSRLLQIMINLLTNSIKFTQYSDVRKIKLCVGASYQKPTGQHHGISFVPQRYNRPCRTPLPEWGHGEDIYIQIAVYDTGKGLDADEMKVLFGRFQQASPKTYKQYGGSGLGLFISRELCELQGGQIGVASRDGQTVFTFYVKAKRWVNEELLIKNVGNGFSASAAASPMVFTRRGSAVLPADGVDSQMIDQLLADGTLLENFRPNSRRSSTRSATPSVDEMETLKEDVREFAEEGTKILEERKLERQLEQQEPLHVLIVEDNTISKSHKRTFISFC